MKKVDFAVTIRNHRLTFNAVSDRAFDHVCRNMDPDADGTIDDAINELIADGFVVTLNGKVLKRLSRVAKCVPMTEAA
jgi:hypothetical protein